MHTYFIVVVYFMCRFYTAAMSLLFECSGGWSGREIGAAQADSFCALACTLGK